MTVLRKYIWVINALYHAGQRGLSLKELNEKWVANTDLSLGEPIPRQTFDRWKGQILDLLGIVIDCHLKGRYRYYIYNPQVLEDGEVCRWLLDTYSTANTLSANMALKGRIMVESIPSSHEFLTEIIDAMRENKLLNITHKSFECEYEKTYLVAPYCVRMFHRRWYMLASNVAENKEQLFALDRIHSVDVTDGKFSMPADFDAKEYFATFFGVVLDRKVDLQRIIIRADNRHKHYLRTLPLHQSQCEIYSCGDYADFEYYLRPTYDFVMELLRVGSMVEVLEPQSLRDAMRGWIDDLKEVYEHNE